MILKHLNRANEEIIVVTLLILFGESEVVANLKGR